MDGSGEITVFRAAQYVRMSTERQQYSTHNQSDKIREYAEKRGIKHLDITSVFNWVPWCPAMSVPAGLSHDGLPIGMHVTAQPHREDLALRAACAIVKQVSTMALT